MNKNPLYYKVKKAGDSLGITKNGGSLDTYLRNAAEINKADKEFRVKLIG